LPEHARAPSEKGRNVPFAGLSIPYGDGVPESIAEPLDDERDNIGLGMKGCCSCAAEGERNEAEQVGDGGLPTDSFSDTSTDLRRISGEGARLGCGVIRGASPSPPSIIQREGSHSVALSPQTLGLEWIPVALTAMRVPCGITYV
jgi:hypothetical protein